MERLTEYAERIGVTWAFVDDLSPNHPGRYSDARRHIEVLDGMALPKTISAFGHELGHATFRDVPSILPHVDARQERRADAWAAHFLIDPALYAAAAAKYGRELDWIAQELGVLKRLVIAYEDTLTRVGDRVYIGARMGAGQWRACLEVA